MQWRAGAERAEEVGELIHVELGPDERGEIARQRHSDGQVGHDLVQALLGQIWHGTQAVARCSIGGQPVQVELDEPQARASVLLTRTAKGMLMVC